MSSTEYSPQRPRRVSNTFAATPAPQANAMCTNTTITKTEQQHMLEPADYEWLFERPSTLSCPQLNHLAQSIVSGEASGGAAGTARIQLCDARLVIALRGLRMHEPVEPVSLLVTTMAAAVIVIGELLAKPENISIVNEGSRVSERDRKRAHQMRNDFKFTKVASVVNVSSKRNFCKVDVSKFWLWMKFASIASVSFLSDCNLCSWF